MEGHLDFLLAGDYMMICHHVAFLGDDHARALALSRIVANPRLSPHVKELLAADARRVDAHD